MDWDVVSSAVVWKWEEKMHDPDTPDRNRIIKYTDCGLRGIDRHLSGIRYMYPHKRTKNYRHLTKGAREHNHHVNFTRVTVEHSIGRLKRYSRLIDPYDGTISRFNKELNMIT